MEKSADISLLGRLGLIGFGLLGRAAAHNLRQQEIAFDLLLRRGGESFARAQAEGFAPRALEEGLSEIDTLYALIPDAAIQETLAPFWNRLPLPPLLGLASGAPLYFELIPKRWFPRCLLVAPKGPLRASFEEGRPLPIAVGAYQAEQLPAAEALARAVGGRQSRLLKTDFRAETLSDLLGEQFVLCGGLPTLMETAFQVLVERGIDPQLAALDVAREVETVLPLLLEGGPQGLAEKISLAARRGGARARQKLLALGLKSLLEKELERMLEKDYFSRLTGEPNASSSKAEDELGAALRRWQEKLDARR